MDLETLMRTKVEESSFGFVCVLCGQAIRLRQNMRNHMRDRHMSMRRYKCPQCHKVLSNRSFVNHVNKVHPNWRGMDYERFRIPDY